MPQLYLASNSPRRREILQNLGYTVCNIAAEIDETPRAREPAHDYVLKCSHTFNLLDARGAISVSQRTAFIGRVRKLARLCAEAYLAQREALGYPMLKKEAKA